MTPTLVYMALTFAAAPPTAEDPRMTLIASHGGRKVDTTVLGQLVTQLGDDSFAVRESAEKRLVLFGPQATAALTAVANNHDPEIAKRASNALKAIKGQTERLPAVMRELLRGSDGNLLASIQRLPNSEVRALAIEVLIKEGMNPSMRRQVMIAWRDPSGRVRSRAWQALHESPLPSLGELLAHSVDAVAKVREAAFMLLHRCPRDDRRILPVLLSALNDKVPGVRCQAASCLGRYPGKQTMDALSASLRDTTVDSFGDSVAGNAANSLTANGDEAQKVLELLATALREAPPATREAVLRAMGHWVRREEAVGSLMVPSLLPMLRDRDAKMRVAATAILSDIGENSEGFIAALVRNLTAVGAVKDDATAAECATIAMALTKIGPKGRTAATSLVRLLNQEDWPGRRYIADALGSVGEDTTSVRTALRRAAEGPRGDVRDAANRALERLTASKR